MFFRDMLAHYRRGQLLRAADDELAAVVRAVRATNKTGELTLKIKINPSKTGDNELGIKAEVTSKVPKATMPDAVFFGDEKGELHRADPAQMDAFPGEEEGAVSLDRRRPGATGEQIANAMGLA
jgi:hypothetical protein